ncbi:MAG: RDD family protein [Anaeroplasma sp.]
MMYNYKLVTNGRRFLAYIIDFILISIISSIISNLFITIVHFDASLVSDSKYILDLFSRYLEAIGSSNDEYLLEVIEEMAVFYKQYMLYLLICNFAVLLVCIVYLVIIPKFTEKQTIGRLVSGCKVVTIDNEKPSYTNLIMREIVGFFLFYNVIGFILIIISGIVAYTTGYSLIDKISKTKLVSTKDAEKIYPENEESNDIIDVKIKEEKNDDEYKVF